MLRALGSARLVACADLIPERAQALARTEPGAFATADWRNILERADVGIVIVATTNDTLAEVGRAAVEAGKHVLIEKPAARNASELQPLIEAAQRSQVQVRVGFNHRYHPALRKAHELYESELLGDNVRARTLRTWRASRL